MACDVYRPAAIKQLQVNGEKVGVPVFAMGDNNKPLDIAKAAVQHAAKNNINLVFLDTAGRLHVDESEKQQGVGWEKILDISCEMIRKYLTEGKYAEKLKKYEAVAAGFVDGDVEILYRR